jgi:hypothetical protein
VLAEPTIFINPAHPRSAHTGSDRKLSRRTFDYFTDNLVTWYQVELNRRQIAFDDVQIRAAYPTSRHA